jgi:hypothetical protein
MVAAGWDGKSRTPEYGSWHAMIGRCTKPDNDCFEYYGGRGITVCDRWLTSFENFLTDMGPKPSLHHTIERIDNNKGYEPGNCKWATLSEQARNRRDNVLLEHDEKVQCLAAWADDLGIKQTTLRMRLKRGWSAERILTTPVNA